ncbi:MAG: 23S rRNA (uracil(1939)-C(5))-methyltransferase RlmD [Candidatus Celerinatantimonas neptuna]|nr:MAG: 23S rRNA (uracil(1939)-C(5))-methyltransferase RlmD [Candidatus Celerinatantimonas neptuna]
MVQFYKAKPVSKNSLPSMEGSVEGVDHQLNGIIRHHQRTFFVADTLPEERVIFKPQSGYHGKLVKRLSSHPLRIAPACRYYKQCGGCQAQILDASDQLALKTPQIAQLITQLSGFVDLPEPLLIQGQPWRYRRITRLSTWFDKKMGWKLGFRAAQGKQVVSINHCLVLTESLDFLLQPLQQLIQSFPKNAGVGHIELIDCLPRPVVNLRLTKNLSPKLEQLCCDFAETYHVHFAVTGMDVQWLCGLGCYYEIDGLTLYFSPGDFIQVNSLMNQQLVDLAIKWLDLSEQDLVADLFCGVGNFTLPIAKQCQSVVAVEGVLRMVEQLRANAKTNHLTNIEAFSGDLSDPETLAGRLNGIDKVLLDPARAGAKIAIELIAKLQVKRVVYIACDPATMARDIAVLKEAGYRLKCWALIDMFSQTSHIETAVLLTSESQH